MNRNAMYAVLAIIVILFVVLLSTTDRGEETQTQPAPSQPLAPAAPSGPAVVLEGPTSASVGEEIRVDLVAHDAVDVLGIQADVTYDHTVLTFDRMEEGVFFNMNGAAESMHLDVLDTTQPGLVKDVVIVKLGAPGVNGDGTIASLYFTASAAGQTTLDFSKLLVGDTTSELIDINQASLTIQIN